jgi:hypothetical protein
MKGPLSKLLSKLVEWAIILFQWEFVEVYPTEDLCSVKTALKWR